LPELQARELIRLHDASRVQHALQYEFRHHTLQRVAYDSVLKRIKRAAHAALARWMATLPDAASLQDQIAEHHERAGERLLAREGWRAAADASVQRFANADALAHAERALALTGEHESEQRLLLTVFRLRVLRTISDRPRMTAVLDEFEHLAQASGDPGWMSEAAGWRARLFYVSGDAAAALSHAQRAVSLAPDHDVERAAQGQAEAFFALTRLARYAEARAAAASALELAQRCGNTRTHGSLLNQLGALEFDQGDIVAACAHWQGALALHRGIGHLGNEAGTLSNLAFAAMSVGDFSVACEQFEAARDLFERVGQQKQLGIVCINLGLVTLHLGRPRDALAHAQRALELLRLPGDRWAEAAALRVHGQALRALGRGDAARECFIASRDLFDELKLENVALEAMAALSAEALDRGDVAQALHHAEQIITRQARGVGLGGTDEPMGIPLAVWRALRAAGDERAAAVLAQAQQELRERSERLVDARQRHAFLNAVSYHRELAEAGLGSAGVQPFTVRS
jgi:tetratricopeptide (TPR) repeat protein